MTAADLGRGPDRYDRMELRERARRVCLGCVVGGGSGHGGVARDRPLSDEERNELARDLAEVVAELCDRLDDAEDAIGAGP